jgi:biopolymer transport protein TolR
MRMPRKTRRLAREDRHSARDVEINIVSLIDIFAILVFYLLVNALAVEILPSPQSLKLPESAIEEQPRETTVILVTKDDILVNNARIMGTAEAMAADSAFLAPLKSELMRAPLMRVEEATTQTTRGEVNIMADKTVPYRLLKKIMATCTETRFAKISLAVVEKQGGAP